MERIRVLGVNMGSTSTKIAYYENERCVLKETLDHPAEQLARLKDIFEQYELRRNAILDFLDRSGINAADIDVYVSRGAQTQPITGGVYRINEKMIEQAASGKYGVHIINAGIKIVYDMAREHGKPAFIVDSPVTDELQPCARYSGIPEITRPSGFHALNHKAVGAKYAKSVGREYSDLNLIIVHMGGGITVAAHRKGLAVDCDYGLEGDGPFSTNRSGGLPVGPLVDLCYSGKYTKEQMHRLLNGEGGLAAYLGETDVRNIESRALSGDAECEQLLKAMCYQTAKAVGAYAAVLCGRVDAILLTGGIVNSEFIVNQLSEHIGFIAPIAVYAGEFEMESLCQKAYAAAVGRETIHEMQE